MGACWNYPFSFCRFALVRDGAVGCQGRPVEGGEQKTDVVLVFDYSSGWCGAGHSLDRASSNRGVARLYILCVQLWLLLLHRNSDVFAKFFEIRSAVCQKDKTLVNDDTTQKGLRMGYYVIAIGGTGAKCAEALTHLCAAGLLSGDRSTPADLYTFFVDPDQSNGSLERARITLKQYQDCRRLKLGETRLFNTSIELPEPDSWSPFIDQSATTLDELFRYSKLSKDHPTEANLLDVLYSYDERTTTLAKGFLGHPSIGAAVLAGTIDLETQEPWKSMWTRVQNDIKNGQETRLFLVGSIFGGTGAAGFPTIAQLIRRKLDELKQKNYRIGGLLVLPYFSFESYKSQDVEVKLRASSENFLMSAQAALQYYYDQSYQEVYDSIYLLGDHHLSPVKTPVEGGKEQKNEQHFIELFGAMAAVDFFSWDGKERNPIGVMARDEENLIRWEDLPDLNNGTKVKKMLGQLLRFCFAYLSTYKQALDYIQTDGQTYAAPWYVDYFERGEISINEQSVQKAAKDVQEYAESFLNWLVNIHTSAKGQKVQLAKFNAFEKELVLLDYNNLVLPMIAVDRHGLSDLWENLCDYKLRDERAAGFGRFIRSLHECCS